MGKKVSVLVVDDSHICRQLICEALSRDPDLEVVGTCTNGQEALEAARELRPQVITMDVEMPVMDGLTAVEHIMAEVPTPILMLTADPRQQAPELTCRALELGALGLRVKPSIDDGLEAWNLAKELKLLSSGKVIDAAAGAAEDGALHDAVVRQRIVQDEVAGAVHVANHGFVRRVSADEQDRILSSDEVGDASLKLSMERLLAGD